MQRHGERRLELRTHLRRLRSAPLVRSALRLLQLGRDDVHQWHDNIYLRHNLVCQRVTPEEHYLP